MIFVMWSQLYNIYLSIKGKIVGSLYHPILTEELLEDYTSLTYLSKGEILYLMRKFKSIDPKKVLADYHHRFSKDKITEKFDVLRNNPFKDRIFRVFSSKNDDCFSFEDLLDLCSAMSADCPPDVKATWAFRIYDLDEDNQISERDIRQVIDRLLDTNNAPHKLDDDSKTKICKIILDEIKWDNSDDGISLGEFKYMLARFPEFETSFYFRM